MKAFCEYVLDARGKWLEGMCVTPEIRRYFLGALRSARGMSLANSESFEGLAVAIERLGALNQRSTGLRSVEPRLREIAAASPLASSVPRSFPGLHRTWNRTFDFARQARNEAVHHGARARHLTNYWVVLALMLEDAIMIDARTAGEFMVSNPTVASAWQPVSFIRQIMLANAFSYVPFQSDSGWALLSDLAVARYLDRSRAERESRLRTSLSAATKAGLALAAAPTCDLDTPVSALLEREDGLPFLVLSEGQLLGIISPADLL